MPSCSPTSRIPSRDLLDRLHEVEAAFDRVRVVRWGPRTLDIDIITVAGEHSDDPDLTLPHPRAHERAFVLAPWHDVDPDAVLPGYGPVAGLLGGGRPDGDPPVQGAPRASGGGIVKPTRTRTLLLIVVLAAAVTWAVLDAVYASLPPLTWTGVPALLIAAGAEAWLGRDLRARIQGKRGARPAPPLFVARMVALAKASSQTAALLAGSARVS